MLIQNLKNELCWKNYLIYFDWITLINFLLKVWNKRLDSKWLFNHPFAFTRPLSKRWQRCQIDKRLITFDSGLQYYIKESPPIPPPPPLPAEFWSIRKRILNQSGRSWKILGGLNSVSNRTKQRLVTFRAYWRNPDDGMGYLKDPHVPEWVERTGERNGWIQDWWRRWVKERGDNRLLWLQQIIRWRWTRDKRFPANWNEGILMVEGGGARRGRIRRRGGAMGLNDDTDGGMDELVTKSIGWLLRTIRILGGSWRIPNRSFDFPVIQAL